MEEEERERTSLLTFLSRLRPLSQKRKLMYCCVLVQPPGRRRSLTWPSLERARACSTSSTNPFVSVLPSLLLRSLLLACSALTPTPLRCALLTGPAPSARRYPRRAAHLRPARRGDPSRFRRRQASCLQGLGERERGGEGGDAGAFTLPLPLFPLSVPLEGKKADEDRFGERRASSARSSCITSFRVSSSGRSVGGRTIARSCRLWSRTWRG